MQRWTRSRSLPQGRSLHVCWRGTTSTRSFFSSFARRTAPHTEHVHVPCASAGHVTVSLHDVSKHPVSTPLIINLPAYPTQDINDVDAYLPSFLHQYPSATIHYRWSRDRDWGSDFLDEALPPSHQSQHAAPSIPTMLQWPTPITDTLAAYDFLRKTLSPSARPGGTPLQRRDIYVHGSYLGASLAASLALTETHAHEPVAVRGLSAYNGIYNWTTFLPDHPINRLLLADEMLGTDVDRADEDVAVLRDLMPTLFGSPGSMFDPFASPVLFFHTSGLMVPPSFTERWTPPHLSPGFAGALDALSGAGAAGAGDTAAAAAVGDIDPYDYVYSDPEDPPPPALYPEAETDPEAWEDLGSPGTDEEDVADETLKLSDEPDSSSLSSSSVLSSAAAISTTTSPRKGYLAFPPRWSTLKIPDTLLLHSTAPRLPRISSLVVGRRRRLALWKKLKNAQNSFATQAAGLGSLMRRSVEKLELRERMRWDEELDDCAGEAAKRVRVEDAGGGGSNSNSSGEELDGFRKGERAEEIAAQWFEERMF